MRGRAAGAVLPLLVLVAVAVVSPASVSPCSFPTL